MSQSGSARMGAFPVLSEKMPGLSDLLEGIQRWRLWTRLAWMETLRRYRRTTLGPFWTTLTVAIFVTTIGLVFPSVMGTKTEDYLPYFASGFIVWGPLAAYVNESCGAFYEAEGILKQIRLPYTMFICSTITRNMIVFFHNVIVFVAIVFIFDIPVNLNTLLIIPGLVLLCLNAFWVGLFLATICSRYRDIQQIVANLMQVAFFLTPIIWRPDQVGKKRIVFVESNVLHHVIDLVRAPMLGKVPALNSYIIVVLLAVVGWAFALWFFGRYRRRIIYWL